MRTESERGVALESLATMGQRDALLLFRTLCKMAMKDGSEELVTRTKVLSLQLLQVPHPTQDKRRSFVLDPTREETRCHAVLGCPSWLCTKVLSILLVQVLASTRRATALCGVSPSSLYWI